MDLIATCNFCKKFKVPWDEIGKAVMQEHLKEHKENEMSELTTCNYCSLQKMKARAKERGVEVVVATHSFGEMRGWTSARYSNEEEPSHWFMQLTAHCVC